MYMYKRVLKDIFKILILSCIMGIVIYLGTNGIISDIESYSLFARIMMLCFLIIFAVVFYFTSLFVFKVVNLETLKKYVKRS